MGLVLLIILILLLLGAFQGTDRWGNAPGGAIVLVLVIILILIALGHVSVW